MTNSQKIQVLYIAGSGHSGSTLLDLILSTAPDAYGVGEAVQFARCMDKYKQGGEKCCDDTGKELSKSDFWQPIVRGKESFIKPKKIRQSKIEKWKFLLGIGKNKKELRYDNAKFFELILQEAQKRTAGQDIILIDSSKNIGQLVSLVRNESIDLSVIHLLRDPRGVANSSIRRGSGWFFHALWWSVVNTFIAIYVRLVLPKEKTMTLWYEDFAKNTSDWIGRINAKFGLSCDPQKYIQRVQEQTSYRFSGNAMRHKKITEVRLDEKWREQLSGIKKKIISSVTFLPRVLLKK